MVDLVFDLDGCLIDSLEVQKAAFFGSYKENVGDDKCPPFDEYLRYTGDSIPNVFRRMGLPLSMVESYRRISRELVDKIVVNSDCLKLIKKCRGRGSRIAICTGKDRNRTIELLKKHNIYEMFDVLVCSDDVDEPKPSPMPLKRAIQLLNSTNDNCLYIGDGYNDYVCAKKARVSFVLACWYESTCSGVETDYTAKTVGDLESIIDALSGAFKSTNAATVG